MKHISIMGSCVSRDIFGTHENDGDYKIDKYAFSISPISAVSRSQIDIDYMEVLNLFSDIQLKNFHKRNWAIDLTGSAFAYLSSATSDYLLVDMNNCRYNYYNFQEGFLTKHILGTQKEKEMFSLFFSKYGISVGSVIDDEDSVCALMDQYLPRAYLKTRKSCII